MSGISPLKVVTKPLVIDRFPIIQSGSLIEMPQNGAIGEIFHTVLWCGKNVLNRPFFTLNGVNF